MNDDFETVRDGILEYDGRDEALAALDRIKAENDRLREERDAKRDLLDQFEGENARLREALERIAADRTTSGNAGNTASAAESWYAKVAREALGEETG